jgi:nitrogenase-associated protein
MSKVLFFEKPGCINNTRQKKLLAAAGHEVDARNLLTEAWSTARLRPFFGGLPVAEWFNKSAPRVKSGEVKPERVSEEMALALMVADPLLIRRPLMQVGEERMVGFDSEQVDAWIGLTELPGSEIEACPRSSHAAACSVE